MAFGKKQEELDAPLAGGGVRIPESVELEAILARAGSDLADPDLELLEVVRERFGALSAAQEKGEGEEVVFQRLFDLVEAVDQGIGSTRVAHATRVASRNVLARCGIVPIQVGPGDFLGRVDRVAVEVLERREYSRRHDYDHIERIESRGYQLATGEILRPARVVASSGCRPELLRFLDGARRFAAGLSDEQAPAWQPLLDLLAARESMRREDLLHLVARFEDEFTRRLGAGDGSALRLREIFLDPLREAIAAEGRLEPFGEPGGEPDRYPAGAVDVIREDHVSSAQRGRITRIISRGYRDARSGRVLVPARVAVGGSSVSELVRAVRLLVGACDDRVEEGGANEEIARRLRGSLGAIEVRLDSLSRTDLDAVTSVLGDLQGFLAEYVLDRGLLASDVEPASTARDLASDLVGILGSWGCRVFPGVTALYDPLSIDLEALRAAEGDGAVEVEGVFESGVPAGSVLFVRTSGLALDESLITPASLVVALGERLSILGPLERLESRLPEIGTDRASVSEEIRVAIAAFRDSLTGRADLSLLLPVVNALDEFLHGKEEPSLARLVRDFIEELATGGIEECPIEVGVHRDALPPGGYVAEEVRLEGRGADEVVRVVQRSFRNTAAGGILLQPARVEVNVASE